MVTRTIISPDSQIKTPVSVSRRDIFLNGPIALTLFHLSWPNIVVMVAQASTGLIETWWLSYLGTDALAGMAIVFPVVMVMQMMSGGAVGGGISSAIARALGRNDQEEADALVLHALIIDVVLGVTISVLVLTFGRPLYRLLGGEGASLEAALSYSNVVFSGITLLWIMNGLASIIRGTGNMKIPAIGVCSGVFILVPLSPLLIFGIGPFPELGMVGGGVALLLYYLAGTLFFGWYILSGRNTARFRWVRLQWPLFREILRVGAFAALLSFQTSLTIIITTSFIGHWFGSAEVAGFGTGARLEFLLMPLVFGIGTTLVAMIGMNIGAGQKRRALRIAFTGGVAAFMLTETVGIIAAIWPEIWLGLFDTTPAMLESGSAYLRIVGPFYGFYGLGFSLYFAAQGAGCLFWPVMGGFVRLVMTALGGWVALVLTGSAYWLYVVFALGLILYGVVIATTTPLWARGEMVSEKH